MGTKFSDYVANLERSADPETQAALQVYDEHYTAERDRLLRLSRALATARQNCGLTQTQLAELTGVQQSEISRLERGQGNPTLETLTRLVRPLHARIALVDESGHVLT